MKTQLPYFSNKQRRGLVAFVVLIVLLQAVILVVKSRSFTNETADYKIDTKIQLQIDSLKKLALKKYDLQPFNPNFITDYKGFQLGMTIAEIDKLLKFRSTGKYVNSAAEFQQVTGVSKELLDKISPYFKFPEWTQNKKSNTYVENSEPVALKNIDLNKATVEDLVAIKGIGDYYANAVINEREKLGGFVSIHQIDFIKGLRPEAVKILKQNTNVKPAAAIQKININTATKEQLAQIPYVNSHIARQIVVYRSKQENPLKIEDLEKINNFPLDKLKIIRLYLAF